MPVTIPEVVPILRRANATIAASGTSTSGKIACLGHKRVFGIFVPSGGAAPSAGYPRIRQSTDGQNFDRTLVIQQDVTSGFYPFDVNLEGSYVLVEWSEGSGGSLRAGVFIGRV